MKKLRNIEYNKDSNTVDIVSTQGTKRALPSYLCEKLADILDPFSSQKDFIGYVDPEIGIVLVDASTLIGTCETQTRDECDNVEQRSGRSKKINQCNEPIQPFVSNEAVTTSVSPSISKKKETKTMHQLVYEKKWRCTSSQ